MSRQCTEKGTVASGRDNNSTGGKPSNGDAAKVRKAIPGVPSPVRAHRFCFGLGAEDIAEQLQQTFAPPPHGFGKGAITGGGCNIPNFPEAGVSTGTSLWELDENGNLALPVHNTNGTVAHPGCQNGGTVPVEKVNGSWRLCRWALPYITAGEVVLKDTQAARNNSSRQRKNEKKAKK